MKKFEYVRVSQRQCNTGDTMAPFLTSMLGKKGEPDGEKLE